MVSPTRENVEALEAEIATLRQELAVARQSAQVCDAAVEPPARPGRRNTAGDTGAGRCSIFHAIPAALLSPIDFAVGLMLVHNGRDPAWRRPRRRCSWSGRRCEGERFENTAARRVEPHPRRRSARAVACRVDDITFPPGARSNIAARVGAARHAARRGTLRSGGNTAP